MAEENKKPKATVKKPSIVRDLVTYAIREEIEPRSTEIMHSVFTGVLDMFGDAARKTIDHWMYPEGNAPKGRSKPLNTQATNYNTRTYDTTANSTRERNPKPKVGQRSSRDVQLIWVDNEADAKEIVTTLYEAIDNYEKAKVAEYYETVNRVCNTNIPIAFPDFNYGWSKDEKNGIGYFRDRGKYYIDLPKPINIENI
ncbi:MAG: hypothetical protein J6U54_18005 [Clostridiales bacterium]|nr:hypothetical protein [Clostridiales bacterium]